MGVKLHTVDMIVHDMAASVEFYRRLGLFIPEGDERSAHVEVITPDGYVMGMDTEQAVVEADPDWRPPRGGQRVSLQFECDSPAEVDSIHHRLVAAGAELHTAPWDTPWGQRFGRVRDPDGNVISLFAEL